MYWLNYGAEAAVAAMETVLLAAAVAAVATIVKFSSCPIWEQLKVTPLALVARLGRAIQTAGQAEIVPSGLPLCCMPMAAVAEGVATPARQMSMAAAAAAVDRYLRVATAVDPLVAQVFTAGQQALVEDRGLAGQFT